MGYYSSRAKELGRERVRETEGDVIDFVGCRILDNNTPILQKYFLKNSFFCPKKLFFKKSFVKKLLVQYSIYLS